MTRQTPHKGLRHQAARGVAWTTLDAVGTRLITTVVFIVLARLLEPAEFGLVALSLVFIGLTRLLVDQGFGPAIVQKQTLTKGHLDTSFWTAVLVGVVLAGVLCLIAEPLSSALGQPDLAPVLQALSLVVAFGAPESTATAVLKRQFGFRQLAMRKVFGAVVGGAAGVAAAIAGLGVWSLVTQALVQAAVGTIVLWAVTPFRPGLQVSRADFKELFAFGNKVIGITFVNFLSKRADDLLIGAVLGPTALGLYSVAYRLLTIMNEVLTRTIETVALPTFSRLQTDLLRLRSAYETLIRTSASIAAPAYLVVAVLAPDIIDTFFGEKWAASIPVMQALSLAGLAQALVASTNTILLSVGRAKTALYLSATYALVNVVGFLIAVQFGILAVAIAFAARAYLLAPLSVLVVKRVLDFSWMQWLRLLIAPVFSAVLTAGLVLGVRAALVGEVGAPARLAIALPLAAVVYLALFRLTAPRHFRELFEHAGSAVPSLRRLVPRARPSHDAEPEPVELPHPGASTR